MCNWKKWFWPGLVAVALLTALSGWFYAGPVENDLTARVANQFKSESSSPVVSFDGRDATLSGIAENDQQKLDAAKVALGTYGVRIVSDQMKLPEKVEPFPLTITKDANGVTLIGNYDSAASRAALVAAAEQAMPGIAVTDKLTIAAGKPDGFDALAGFGFGQLADLTKGEVSLSNLNYSIKGMPIDPATYARLVAATSGVLPSNGILKSADIAVPPLGKPYELTGSYDGALVNLTGYAPSREASVAVEDKAKSLFPNKIITNALIIAAGAPSNFVDLANFGLTQLATMENGAFSFTDMMFSMKGTPSSAAGYDDLLLATKGNLPAGVTLGAVDIMKPVLAAPEPSPAPVAQQVPTAIFVPTPEAKACADGIAALLAASQINFQTGNAIIEESSKPLLDSISSKIVGCAGAKMEIAGHTDSDGTEARNLELSQSRADAVRNYLLGKSIAAAQISAKGYGATQPLAANDTDENKAKNRRIEFRLVQ